MANKKWHFLASTSLLLVATTLPGVDDHSATHKTPPKTARESMFRQAEASRAKYAKSLNDQADEMKRQGDRIDAKVKQITQDSRDRRSQLKGLPGVQDLPGGARLWVNPNYKEEVPKKDVEVMQSHLEEQTLLSELRKFLSDYDKAKANQELDSDDLIPLLRRLESSRAKSDKSYSILSKLLQEKIGHKISAADKVLYFRTLRLMVERHQQALDALKKEKSVVSASSVSEKVLNTTDFKSKLGGVLASKQEARLDEAKNFASSPLLREKSFEIAVLRQGKGAKLKNTIDSLSQWAKETFVK